MSSDNVENGKVKINPLYDKPVQTTEYAFVPITEYSVVPKLTYIYNDYSALRVLGVVLNRWMLQLDETSPSVKSGAVESTKVLLEELRWAKQCQQSPKTWQGWYGSWVQWLDCKCNSWMCRRQIERISAGLWKALWEVCVDSERAVLFYPLVDGIPQ